MNSNKNNPKINYIYNIIYQILILIIPLVTAPYLARVVGADGVGTYSYTYSIVYYFMLFTLLGVNNYGNRTIAKTRDNKEKLSKTFWEIYILQLILGLLMLIIYNVYLLLICNKYKLISLIQSLFIISAILDINWFFFGIEEFKKTITRNTIVKLLNLILILVLVKSKNDLWKYTLIMSGTTCLGQIILWKFIKGKISIVKIKVKDIIKHIKPNIILFIPVISVSLYKMMDKVMLGSLSGVTEVGFYENAEKIVNVPMTFITALGTVMLPRMSNIVSKGNIEKLNSYIEKSISFVMFLAYAMCFGLVSVGEIFSPLYFGNEFIKSGSLIMLLAFTLPFLAFANVLRTQYLIPREKDKIYIISVSMGAVINLIINIILIPKFASIGACIGTIIAEATVMIYQSISLKKELPIGNYIKKIIPFLFKGILMLIIIYPFKYLSINRVYILIIEVVFGMIIYGLSNIKYILSVVDIRKLSKVYFKKKNIILNDNDNDSEEEIIIEDINKK